MQVLRMRQPSSNVCLAMQYIYVYHSTYNCVLLINFYARTIEHCIVLRPEKAIIMPYIPRALTRCVERHHGG